MDSNSETHQEPRRRNVLILFSTFLAGNVVAWWFRREQVLRLASKVSSYFRRRSEVKSGDGKAD